MIGPTSQDPILEKIRKLLAKAEDDACTPAEAEAFTAKATELIAKYGIDAALLAEATPGSDRVGDRVILIDAPYARDKLSLLAFVAYPLRCKVIERPIVGGMRAHLFGFGADLDRVELLYTSLLVQAAHALAATRVPWGEHPAAYRRSWYHGYGAMVGSRLYQAEARAQANAEADQPASTENAGRSVALVLADRGGLVQMAMAAAYPDVKTAAKRRLSGSGRDDGIAAGRRADLGGPRVGQRTGRELAR